MTTRSVWPVSLVVYLMVVCTCTHASGVCRCDLLTARELLVHKMYQRLAVLQCNCFRIAAIHTMYIRVHLFL